MTDEASCARTRELLSVCCDGEAERTAELDLHLVTCVPCREFAEGCARSLRLFADLRSALPPADLEPRILARAALAPTRRALLLGDLALRAAAGLIGLLTVGGFALVFGRPPPPPRAPLSGWLEPLAGRALHSDDGPLRGLLDVVTVVTRDERPREKHR